MSYQVSNIIVYDLEVYRNYFLAGFQTPDGVFHQYDQTLIQELIQFLDWARRDHVLAGWNSNSYDDPVLTHFLDQRTPDAAFEMSKSIINDGVDGWSYPNDIRSIDLMRILPGRLGLKKIGVCLGHKRLQELPIPWDKELTEDDKLLIQDYNRNDLEITRKVQLKLQPDLDLRAALSDRYNRDLRSKGEAQIAETVLVTASGEDPKALKNAAQDNRKTWTVRVRKPTWWDRMKKYTHRFGSGQWHITDIGERLFEIDIPILESSRRLSSAPLSRTIYMGDKYYKMGIGGLHSVDGSGSWLPTKDQRLIDIDVASYYPNLMLTQNLAPRHWGAKFLDILQSVVEERLRAKKEGDKTTASTLKIVTNGTFGKTSDPYSAIYDPWVTANVTVLGQLTLLFLIALLMDEGISTVSANTDGITVPIDRDQYNDLIGLVSSWERLTGLVMEYTEYSKLLQLDVNNYLALTTKGGIKTKGRLNPGIDLRHTPNFPIVAKALCDYIQYDIPIESTIYGCSDINQFILTQQVVGDWTTSWQSQPLGKMLRWYKSKSSQDALMRHPGPTAKGNEGIVSNGENAVPLENLPDVLPDDILYPWYLEQAYNWLERMTRPHTRGNNEKVEKLIKRGLHPVIVKHDQSTRARPPLGSIDFNSLDPDQVIAVATGKGILAKIENGKVSLHKTTKDYPSKTRKTIEKKCGFRLVYGSSVTITDATVHPEEDWDAYYTPAELRKVGR